MTERRIPVFALGKGLAAFRKGRYAINIVAWAAMWVIPVIPALITQAFFDRITGEATAGYTVTTLAVLMAAYGIGRISIMVLAMWNDQLLSFRISTLLRRNMLEQIFHRPGAQAIEESPGEAISRFRDDVDEIEESFGWSVDMLGIGLFSAVALWILIGIDGTFTFYVFAPTAGVVWIAAVTRSASSWVRTRTSATAPLSGATTLGLSPPSIMPTLTVTPLSTSFSAKSA